MNKATKQSEGTKQTRLFSAVEKSDEEATGTSGLGVVRDGEEQERVGREGVAVCGELLDELLEVVHGSAAAVRRVEVRIRHVRNGSGVRSICNEARGVALDEGRRELLLGAREGSGGLTKSAGGHPKQRPSARSRSSPAPSAASTRAPARKSTRTVPLRPCSVPTSFTACRSAVLRTCVTQHVAVS